MDYEIHPVSAENSQDYLDFFDNRAFCDNPDWAGCYCVFNQFAGSEADWMATTARQNRAAALRMIQDGSMKGYLAYADGKVVGWCNANDKRAYPHFSQVGDDGDSRVYAVTCFVIDPSHRRQGIARALLRRAMGDAAAAGYDSFEAYPIEGEGSAATHYHGHPVMYESEGFAVRLRFEGRLCMSRSLKGE